MSADVSLHGRTAPATFFIVENGTPLMGRVLMNLVIVLHVCIADNKVLPPDTPASTSPPTPVLQCSSAPVHLLLLWGVHRTSYTV